MPSTSLTLLASATLVKQGAEAKVYKSTLHPAPNLASLAPDKVQTDASQPVYVLLKHRFQKNYRHPTLNASLTRSRVAGEARALMKCLRAGVNVPGIRMVDAAEGTLGIEWIEGESVRVVLGGGEDGEEIQDDEQGADADIEPPDLLAVFNVNQNDVMVMIGTEIAKMHLADIIHGDLTTSNMMLRRKRSLLSTTSAENKETELLLIDFGLSYISALVEDKAVDLYVLERAFASTHPDSEPLFALVMQTYAEKSGKDWKAVGRKLDEVRLRGRKRSMVG
ncbi:hypothetical protein BD410DRAFT_787240 [Rickenella mellea]|uniref:non-specific serine/threonine protein kinase n=1 Tax=Rickenella mellea TaxID=50990 RepID=A0A4Y7Q701_9AGAM|nr:hypothetical protein BD410DRAFT_787240 [Rickenella mellea]